MKILIAEDDAETGAYLRKGLLAEGHSVDLLCDGRESLAQATAQPYDLFIFDRMLPGLDGLSVLRALRAAQIPTPVILLTAMGSVEDRCGRGRMTTWSSPSPLSSFWPASTPSPAAPRCAPR